MSFIVLTICGFIGMEIFSYLAHRFLFHGILWKIHQTHHRANKFFLETNDVFSLIFAILSVGLMMSKNRIFVPIGTGIAVYGLIYFITHDFFTHRRFLPFKSKNKLLLTIRRAHQRHHQTTAKNGIEPFGLFFFDYAKFRRQIFQSKTKNAKVRTTSASPDDRFPAASISE